MRPAVPSSRPDHPPTSPRPRHLPRAENTDRPDPSRSCDYGALPNFAMWRPAIGPYQPRPRCTRPPLPPTAIARAPPSFESSAPLASHSAPMTPGSSRAPLVAPHPVSSRPHGALRRVPPIKTPRALARAAWSPSAPAARTHPCHSPHSLPTGAAREPTRVASTAHAAARPPGPPAPCPLSRPSMRASHLPYVLRGPRSSTPRRM
ncbi:hypothetical protein CesoFtcFv8_019243 [Champsocephalus esox]|uniref:Uncharacterized protein n=1 Tax=Champsocephalus esox TaxID=159716 RepID=A0AAN8GN32_9TELE|nr:hypothetical protein CesoFtcFv8_019243 [Champsocephalus esox]